MSTLRIREWMSKVKVEPKEEVAQLSYEALELDPPVLWLESYIHTLYNLSENLFCFGADRKEEGSLVDAY